MSKPTYLTEPPFLDTEQDKLTYLTYPPTNPSVHLFDRSLSRNQAAEQPTNQPPPSARSTYLRTYRQTAVVVVAETLSRRKQPCSLPRCGTVAVAQ